MSGQLEILEKEPALAPEGGVSFSAPDVMWFRRDLRLMGNDAFSKSSYGNTIYVYVLTKEENAAKTAKDHFLHQSLSSLHASLKKKGAGLLVLVDDDPVSAITQLCRRENSRNLYVNTEQTPDLLADERRILSLLPAHTIFHACGNPWLIPGPFLTNKSGTPYRVFTPFWKRLKEEGVGFNYIPAPSPQLCSPLVQDFHPVSSSWGEKILSHWSCGENSAHEKLLAFLSCPSGTYSFFSSTLSPHLAFGEISSQQIWEKTNKAIRKFTFKKDTVSVEILNSFLRQLVWRDFGRYLWYHNEDFPHTHWRPPAIPFVKEDKNIIKAWQEGRLGIPLVDAGMRELWETGWMPNRIRMVVADFFCKHLGYDWRLGAEWFLKTLVDADHANNSLGWQWASGTGPDAAPYYRIFNPIRQAEKYDPDGMYRKKWLPELSSQPLEVLSEPWKFTTNYPKPLKMPKQIQFKK